MINPVAQTPFPNACSVETRQRAREKMKALAKRGMVIDSNRCSIFIKLTF